MENIHINADTPIAMLTVRQFQQILQSFIPEAEPIQDDKNNDTEYVYGLRGIKVLFNVSLPTAQRYKDTFLKSAVKQNGRKIIIDKKMALELFSDHNKK